MAAMAGSLNQRIVKLLEGFGESLSIKDVAAKLGEPYAKVANHLSTMASRGQVKRVGRGIYVAAPDEPKIGPHHPTPSGLPSVPAGWLPEHVEPREYVGTSGIKTLTDLLDHPDSVEADLIVEALKDLLRDSGGEALEAWRCNREAEAEAFSATTLLWQTLGEASANRRDGLALSMSGVPWNPGSPRDKVPWLLTFPAKLGGASPSATIHAGSLMDAIDIVNRRFPIASWWRRVDGMRA